VDPGVSITFTNGSRPASLALALLAIGLPGCVNRSAVRAAFMHHSLQMQVKDHTSFDRIATGSGA
jgi:hypothetical protein